MNIHSHFLFALCNFLDFFRRRFIHECEKRTNTHSQRSRLCSQNWFTSIIVSVSTVCKAWTKNGTTHNHTTANTHLYECKIIIVYFVRSTDNLCDLTVPLPVVGSGISPSCSTINASNVLWTPSRQYTSTHSSLSAIFSFFTALSFCWLFVFFFLLPVVSFASFLSVHTSVWWNNVK